MTDDALLLMGGTNGAPEIRHEVAASVPDPVIWLARGDEATLWCSPFDIEPIRAAGALEDVHTLDDLGFLELRPKVLEHDLWAELTRRALEGAAVTAVRVPWDFPAHVADHLRNSAVTVTVDAELFAGRRRAKLEWELDGMRAAAHATQVALLEAATLLREFPDGLTCERVRERMTTALLDNGAESNEILVHAGAVVPGGHDLGFGPIERDLPVQIDCFPRHMASGLYADMSRTWVPGTPSAEARANWQDVMDAYELAIGAARPGVDDLFAQVCELFESRGHPTQRTTDGMPEEGFIPALGHGVGLEVHESPSLGRRSDALREGDTVAIEPSLGYEGVGFVMVEETVRVTPEGGRHLVEPLPFGLELPGA